MGNKKHHSSKLERGLDVYDSGNEDDIFAMSSAISKSKCSISTVAQKKLSHRHHRNNLTPVDNNNCSFEINLNNFSVSTKQTS